MIFVTGPLYSGKKEYVKDSFGWDEAELRTHAVWDVQTTASDCRDLAALADELAKMDVVIATEVGGGVVPLDAEARRAREAAGRLSCLLAERADTVIRVFCGLPTVLKGKAGQMKIYLLRHGLTAYNVEKRYQGKTDVPLSPEGTAVLVRADFDPEKIYVTPLRRTAQTASVLFPNAKQIPVADLAEMDFGVFEGRNYKEMADDPDYRAWVDANCESICPGGEGREAFSQRVCGAFTRLVEENRGAERLVILAHGGTQMAIMERFVRPHRDYYSWRAPNAGGYVLSDARWREEQVLELLTAVWYTKQEESAL